MYALWIFFDDVSSLLDLRMWLILPEQSLVSRMIVFYKTIHYINKFFFNKILFGYHD